MYQWLVNHTRTLASSKDLTSERTVLANLDMGGALSDGTTVDDLCWNAHKEIFAALQAIEALGQIMLLKRRKRWANWESRASRGQVAPSFAAYQHLG
jgi:hypothetical protein